MINLDIITQLRTITAFKGISQKDVAERIGMLPQSYSRKLKNQTITLSDLIKIADGLGFELDISFTDKETGKKF